MRLAGLALALVAAGCGEDAERAAAARDALPAEVLAGVLRASPLPSLPLDPTNAFADDARAASFGRALFYDERFSANSEVSCATCHDPDLDWGDGATTATGLSSFEIHTPSLWNVAHNRWYFWDGRADTLWSQAVAPWEHPDEMGGDRVSFVHLLHADQELGALYTELFGPLPDVSGWPASAKPVGGGEPGSLQGAWEEMAPESQAAATRVIVNLAKSVAAFERLMLTTETAFDRYVRGLRDGAEEDLAALGAEELRGMELFFGEARCHLCHHGPLFTDLEFHDVRLPYAVNEAGEDVREMGRWDGIDAVLKDPLNSEGSYSDSPTLLAGEGPAVSGSARGHLEYLLRSPHTKGEF
ncbi:MAG: cytochrome-c peroxidase, partial [Planctomycetes bacterium]|nr:cytochrome-c peroxidase [Planctomycetota bacterium]